MTTSDDDDDPAASPGNLPLAPLLPYPPGSPDWWVAYRALLDQWSTLTEAGLPLLVALLRHHPTRRIDDPDALAQDTLLWAWARMAYLWRGAEVGPYVGALYRAGLLIHRRTVMRRLATGRGSDGADVSFADAGRPAGCLVSPWRSDPPESGEENDMDRLERLLRPRIVQATLRLRDVDDTVLALQENLEAALAYLQAGQTDLSLSPACHRDIGELLALVRSGEVSEHAAWGKSLLLLLAEREWPGLESLMGPVRRSHVRRLCRLLVAGQVGQKWGLLKDTARALGIGEAAAKRALAALREGERVLARAAGRQSVSYDETQRKREA